ncbi:MAG: ATP-binding protein [Ardenticatenaceae bacterium]
MPSNRTLIRIFVAFPSDVREERTRLYQVVKELNLPGGVADQFGCTLQVLDWWDVVPGMGRAEDIILEQLPLSSWDIFIGVLWMRFGETSSGQDVESGFQLAYRAWKKTSRPHISFYRCKRSYPPDILDFEELKKVHLLWKEFQRDGQHPALVQIFQTPDDFERRVRNDLSKLLPRLAQQPSPLPAKTEPKEVVQTDELTLTSIEWGERDQEAIASFFSYYSQADIDVADQSQLLALFKRWQLVRQVDEKLRLTKVGVLLFGPIDRILAYAYTDAQLEYIGLKNYFGYPLMRLFFGLRTELQQLWQKSWEDPSKRDDKGRPIKFALYPETAIIEALVNFIIHRDYEENDLAWITVYEDRIEMTNPGTSPHDVSDLLSGQKLRPKYERNIHLITIFARTTLNQRQGVGIARIIQSLKENGNLFSDGSPALKIINNKRDNRFSIIIYRRNRAPIQGSLQNHSGTVTIIYPSGEQRTIPFLAPPKAPYTLIKQDELLAELKRRLLERQKLAMTTNGGRLSLNPTTLAIELSHDPQLLQHFKDGVLWATLGPKPNILELLNRWAVALGIPSHEMVTLTSVEAKVTRIRALIGTRQMLLVVDDAWRAEDALSFRLGGPNCAYLFTTPFAEIAWRFAGEAVVVPEREEKKRWGQGKQIAAQVLTTRPKEMQKLLKAV